MTDEKNTDEAAVAKDGRPMSGLEFSVPYNNDPETLTEIFKWKACGGNRIREIYLSGPQEYAGSGRISKEQSFDDFARTVERIHREGIRVNLLMNSVCEGDDWYSAKVLNATMDYLKRVFEGHGVEAVTIANPMYIREVRRRFQQVEICASVLGDIDCIDKAVVYRKAGADSFTPDVNINRNLGLLKKIREKTGLEIKLMVNEGCLSKCPFRKFHFNYIAHKSRNPGADGTRGEDNVFSLNCIQVTKSDPAQLLKSGWIRPEDLGRYGEITNFFKLVGRTSSRSMICRSLEAYMRQSWDGDLLELMAGNLYSYGMSNLMHLDNRSLDAAGFFEKVTSCGRECIECDFCGQLARKLIKRGVFTSEKIRDLGLH
jgi:collagenase-like PrtC family protease